MNAERVWKFEGVEEGVGDDCRAVVRATRLQEPADHLRSQYAAEFVAELYCVTAAVRSHARLYPHVELTCARFNNRQLR